MPNFLFIKSKAKVDALTIKTELTEASIEIMKELVNTHK